MIEITSFLLKHLYELMADDYNARHTNTAAAAASIARARRRQLLLHQQQQQQQLRGDSQTTTTTTQQEVEEEDDLDGSCNASSNRLTNNHNNHNNNSSETITTTSREQETNQQIVSFLANNHLPDLICETFIELLFICVFLAVSWIFVMIVQLHCTHQQNSQQPAKLFYYNKTATTAAEPPAAAPVESNDLAPSGIGQEKGKEKEKEEEKQQQLDQRRLLQQNHHFHHHHHQLEQQLETTTKLLSRRLDLLEFELRKTILLLHHQTRIKSTTADNTPSSSSSSSFPSDKQTSQDDDSNSHSHSQQHNLNNLDQTNAAAAAANVGKSQQYTEALADLSSRLELMEKFITVTTKKLYDTEQRVKQLERCDCNVKCKWMQPADFIATITNSQQQQQQQQQNRTISFKMDGQIWRHNCDVCSCQRGHVKCRHVSCPKADCPEPSHVPGRCCPVCHKNCVFNGQTVKHGHKLVINSKQNTCKECLCSDGRLKCHRVELLLSEFSAANSNGGGGGGGGDANNVTTSLPGHRSGKTPTTAETSTLSTTKDLDYLETNNRRRIQRSTPIDLGLNFSLSSSNTNLGSTSSSNSSSSSSLSHSTINGDKTTTIDDHLSQQQQQQQQLHTTDGKWMSLTSFHGSQLVCPQIDCKLEDQIRLKNDCCTYCRGFDFCSLYARDHCHPNAVCIPTTATTTTATATNNDNSLIATLSQEEIDKKSLTLGSMFECRCRSGFWGNGRICRDIDECSEKKLNNCDSRSSYCVNLPGSYQCKCRPGFRDNQQSQRMNTHGIDLSSNLSSILSASDTQTSTAFAELKHFKQDNNNNNNYYYNGSRNSESNGEKKPAESVTILRSAKTVCRDINECSDGKLNRCHQQARCINLNGSYKCRCKRGYLGNGFECHQWFTSKPDVAAYLHRHSSSSSSSSSSWPLANSNNNNNQSIQQQQQQQQQQPNGSNLAINVPLSSFVLDPDDDQRNPDSSLRDDPDSLEYKYDDDDDNNDDDDADGNKFIIDDDIIDDIGGTHTKGKHKQHPRDNNNPSKFESAAAAVDAADLADSRWEPLRFVEQANVFQQTDGLVSASQQVSNSLSGHPQMEDDNLSQRSAHTSNNDGYHQTTATNIATTTTTTTTIEPFVSSLNTRTMFFQPPPRFRRPNNSSNNQQAENAATTANPIILPTDYLTTTTILTTATTSNHNNNSSDMTRSQSLASIRQQSNSIIESSSSSSSTTEQTMMSPLSSESNDNNNNNNNNNNNQATVLQQKVSSAGVSVNQQQQQQPPLKKGSIIASATTSSSRGNSLNANQYHHASQLQHRNLFHQQQKALRVSSLPSSSSASSSSSTFSRSLIQPINLAKVHSLAIFQILFNIVNNCSLNLVFILITTILQYLYARQTKLFVIQ